MLGRAQERSQQDALVSCPLNRINSVIIMCAVSLSNDSKVSMVLFATWTGSHEQFCETLHQQTVDNRSS